MPLLTSILNAVTTVSHVCTTCARRKQRFYFSSNPCIPPL